MEDLFPSADRKSCIEPLEDCADKNLPDDYGVFNNKYTCTTCKDSKYFFDTATEKCSKPCTSALTLDCTSCSLINNQPACTSCNQLTSTLRLSTCDCNDGFYMDKAARQCKKCSAECATCSSPTQCDTCGPDYLTNTTVGLVCYKKVKDCLPDVAGSYAAYENNTCKACLQPNANSMFLSSNTCKNCTDIPLCGTCNDKGECLACTTVQPPSPLPQLPPLSINADNKTGCGVGLKGCLVNIAHNECNPAQCDNAKGFYYNATTKQCNDCSEISNSCD